MKNMLPLPNPSVDRNDLENVVPSLTAILKYAEPLELGNYAAVLEFSVMYSQVTL